MVILSVDYGDQRTGIAVCDPSETLASAVTVIHESYQPKLAQEIGHIVSERGVEMIVIGLPKNMDATIGPRARKCLDLAEVLREQTGLPVEMWDERLTTVMAYQSLDASETFGKKRRGIVDAVSAVIILEDYMKHRKNAGEFNG